MPLKSFPLRFFPIIRDDFSPKFRENQNMECYSDFTLLGSVRTELLAFALALVGIVTLKLENIDKCSLSFKLSLCRNMNSYEDNERS